MCTKKNILQRYIFKNYFPLRHIENSTGTSFFFHRANRIDLPRSFPAFPFAGMKYVFSSAGLQRTNRKWVKSARVCSPIPLNNWSPDSEPVYLISCAWFYFDALFRANISMIKAPMGMSVREKIRLNDLKNFAGK